MAVRESVRTRVEVSPAALFSRVTDIARLPDWNGAITEVLEEPEQLTPGSVWRVRLHALGQSWVSKSTLLELNASDGRFRYRSQTDDGNPSYANWDWVVAPDGTGARLAVAVELHPLTFWRKHLLIHLRRPALRKEMKASLRALSNTVLA